MLFNFLHGLERNLPLAFFLVVAFVTDIHPSQYQSFIAYIHSFSALPYHQLSSSRAMNYHDIEIQLYRFRVPHAHASRNVIYNTHCNL